MKKILMITTGGTIACIKTSSGLIPHATPEELLKEVAIIKTFCNPTESYSVELESIHSSPCL